MKTTTDHLKQAFSDSFRSPSPTNRAKPFWSWNHDLNADELKNQIQQLKEMGISGALVHSRSGLITPYLEKEWFDLVNEICEEALAQDFTLWIYDEDRWPSGTAGGIVTKDPANRQKRLSMTAVPAESFEFKENQIAVFSVQFADGQIERFERIEPFQPLEKGSTILAFELLVMPCTDWYNGGAYLDTLSHESVKAFINSTHRKYAEHCGQYFGNPITSVFTDEPHHESVLAPTIFSVQNNSSEEGKTYELPWTTALPAFFEEKYGYDLLDQLPLVIFDRTGQCANRVRHDFHDCITHLFTDAYAKQVSDWAKEHGLIDTGHIFWESPLNKMASYVGSMLRYMEHMQMPGVDILSTTAVFTDGRNEYDSVKQCASVANQFRKTHILSETYACCGWEFTPEDMKRLGDWQAVLGVNCRCQSCFAYTTANDGKRDFPPSYFHVPWKKTFARIEDYYARINAFISLGQPLRKILVLHPNETMWQHIKADWTETEEYKPVETAYEQLLQWLLEEQMDFDYGDEEIIARRGKVNGTAFEIAQASYHCVIVPDLLTLRESTQNLLQEFRDQGGTVIFTGRIPTHVQGEPSVLPEELAGRCTCTAHTKGEIIPALSEFKAITVTSDQPAESLLCSCRDDDENSYLVVHNTDRNRKLQNIRISLPCSHSAAAVFEADPFTGEQHPVPADTNSDSISIPVDLEPLELKLFRITPGEADVPERPRPIPSGAESCKLVSIERDNANILVLDAADICIDSQPWKKEYLYNADIEIRSRMGWARRRFNMRQPWADPDWHGPQSIPVTLRFQVRFDTIPETLHLAMETPERFDIRINSVPLTGNPDGSLMDHSLKTVPVDTGCLTEGLNTIEMNIDYRKSDGLENICLLGDFNVTLEESEARISAPSVLPAHADLTASGNPFFCGSATYCYTLTAPSHDKAVLSLPQWDGAACSIKINGEPAGDIAFKPYTLELGNRLTDGENRIEITLSSTARNLFGPFHCATPFRGEGWTDPRDYTCPEFSPSNEYTLIPFGITEAPDVHFFNNERN
ncbi:glycosyl hydrolase [Tichowtungia aerotolerans]|uniref:SWIM-type domain-containing protein n=1 Tax=Tichowtungia aerotolerans TaxID=2697043 RepID=A0A6P1M5P2_9BACT|nr:glycosyl hydrolase [Tichowtungia aerotolerans]QHI69177.1 hypothetical protein GT409_06835 [Tichowtungia aerotolerans]